MEKTGNVIVSIGGRLGNMLFSVATASYYARKYNKGLFIYFDNINRIFFKRLYNTYSIIQGIQEYTGKVDGLPVIGDKPDCRYYEIPYIEGDVFFSGSFESEKFFPDNDFLKDLYKIDDTVKETILRKHPDIDTYVGMSIRRGDYLNFSHIFLMPEISWYSDMYHKYFEGRKCLVFSDDIEWCKKNLEKNTNYEFYVPEHFSRSIYDISNPMENIFTFAMCNDHICSHSTWSWWGAKLCEKDGAVNIFPDKRFRKEHKKTWCDYIPDRWIMEKAVYTNDDW